MIARTWSMWSMHRRDWRFWTCAALIVADGGMVTLLIVLWRSGVLVVTW